MTNSSASMNSQFASEAASAAASGWTKASLGSSIGLLGLGAMNLNEFLAVAGLCATVATILINWYYQRKRFALDQQRDERERREFEMRMSEFPQDAEGRK